MVGVRWGEEASGHDPLRHKQDVQVPEREVNYYTDGVKHENSGVAKAGADMNHRLLQKVECGYNDKNSTLVCTNSDRSHVKIKKL